MKINASKKASSGLRVDETIAGQIYHYADIGEYVIRTDDDCKPFVGLADGDFWLGTDGSMYPVDAELVIR